MPTRLPAFRLSGLLVLVGLMLFSACDRSVGQSFGAEIDESDYRLGQRLVKQGRQQEALAAYLRVIEKRGDAAPESHLEAGIICLQQIKDPLAAIYHFRKYLERQPNSPQSTQVRGLVESGKREFARTLPANPLENQSERLNMIEQIERLQRENDQLKDALALARGNPTPSTVSRMRVPTDTDTYAPPVQTVQPVQRMAVDDSPISMAPLIASETTENVVPREPVRSPPTPPAGAVRRHVVQKGDTLFVLAQKYYSNRSRWREIYEANRDIMPNENSLQIGMELKIP